MSLTLMNIPLPTSSRTSQGSKYDFGALTVGGPALVETNVVKAEQAASRLQSAVVAYRKRTGDKSKFSTRIFRQEDGTEAVGVWKVADAPADLSAPASA